MHAFLTHFSSSRWVGKFWVVCVCVCVCGVLWCVIISVVWCVSLSRSALSSRYFSGLTLHGGVVTRWDSTALRPVSVLIRPPDSYRWQQDHLQSGGLSLLVSLVQFVIVAFPAWVSVTGIHVVSVCHRQFGFTLSSSVFRLQGQCYRNTCGFSLLSSVFRLQCLLQEYMWFQSVIVSFLASMSVSVTGIHVVSVCHCSASRLWCQCYV